MTPVSADDEHPRSSDDPAFRDAITFSFGDPVAQVYGLARVAIGGGGASGFAVVYAGDELAGASTEAQVALDAPEDWDAVRAAGVRCSVDTPLASWTVEYAGADAAFELRFEALSPPAALDPAGPVAQAGGLEGYEQLCGVSGAVRHAGRSHSIRCLGQRGHGWGRPDWSRIELARTLSAWMGADRAVTLTAVRPAKAKHHDAELVGGFLIDRGEPLEIFDARLSTTYDGELRQRRAGLELWMSEEGGYARRAAGSAVCGTTVELGELRLDSSFFSWTMEGRAGTGRYDVLRRASGNGGGGLLRRR
ncbi:MAG: hypothetical protein Q8K79_21045 [Solirubrobacteraceae bacterium]|nr:hypothetical protein [Solirubrobacteraceae bacterium]